MTLPPDREAMYQELSRDVNTRLDEILPVNLIKLQPAGHKVFVWDAKALPTHSHYVPVFAELIRDLEEAGEISPEKTTLVETTTGNAGAAASYVASRLGYPLIVFIPEDMPATRIEDIREYAVSEALEPEIIRTPAGRYVEGMVREFQRFLARHRDGYRGRELVPVNHSRKKKSVEVIKDVAERVLARLPQGTSIDCCVLAIGNGTTSSGIGGAVKAHSPAAEVVGVEPLEAPWFYNKKYPGQFRTIYKAEPEFHRHQLIGTGGWGVEFPNVDLEMIDDIQLVEEASWRGMLAELGKLGYNVGHSSAACQCVIARLATLRTKRPQTFFSVFYDPIHKYR